MHNFIRDSSTTPKFKKKLIIQFQKNTQTDRRMDRRTERWTKGQKDGQTLFYRALPATAGDPTSTTLQ